MNEGKIVPAEITISLIKNKMAKSGWGEKKFLISGFPRDLENDQGWEDRMEEYVNFEYVVYFEADEQTLNQRCELRSWNLSRKEDNAETLKKRFKHFEEKELPIIEKYTNLGKVKKINALLSIEEVQAEMNKELFEYIIQ